MIEILVVIVVFLIGILAIVQVFPGGLRLLVQSRNQGVSQQLNSSLLTAMAARADGLPEQILPVKYTMQGGVMVVDSDPTRRSEDYTPLGVTMDSNGVILDSGSNAVGYWPYVSGPNVMRRIVGEGHRVPAPRAVGNEFGGFMTLTFAPVLTSSGHPSTVHYKPAFEVYGADLIENQGAPASGTNPPYLFYIDHASQVPVDDVPTVATLYLPRLISASVETPGTAPGVDDIIFRVSMSVWVKGSTGNVSRRDVVTTVISYGDPSGGFEQIDMSARGNVYDSTGTVIANGIANLASGETLDSVEPESIRVAREFVQVKPIALGGTGFTLDGSGKPNRPYEYEVLDWELGQLLFSPAGYNYFESRPEGRVPLTARVTYDVFDWRIIHDDFRVPDTDPRQYKLTLSGLRVQGNQTADGSIFGGLNLSLYYPPNSTPADGDLASTENRDFALIDMETGGIYLPSYYIPGGKQGGYTIDKSGGLVTFLSADMKLVYPDGTNRVETVHAAGRNVRALYMGNLDWSVQLLKSASQYLQTYSVPNAGQFYVGGTSAFGGLPTRIYFPWADLNQKVRIGELIYKATDTTIKIIRDQDYLITASTPDSLGLPYVDATLAATDLSQLDVTLDSVTTPTAFGYAVKDVKGASMTARALWNSEAFTLGTDSMANLEALRKYQMGYRRSTLDTVVQRGDNL